jgi:hypothetical protein
LTDEIHFYIELETEKNLRMGNLPWGACCFAIAHLGGVQRIREQHHDVGIGT